MEQNSTFTQLLVSKTKPLFTPYITTLYTGLLLCIVGAICIDFYSYYPDFSNGSGVIIFFGILSIMASGILALVIIYKLWEYILREFQDEGLEAPVASTGQAIGLLFMPIYNIYWAFVAYGQIPKCINKLSSQRGSHVQMPDSLGIVISAFMLSGLIPYIGWVLTILASFVLMPIMLYKAIQTIQQIPEKDPNAASAAKIETQEETNLYETRKFLDLFQHKGIGYNFKLVLALIVVALLSNLAHTFLLSNLNYISFNFLLLPIIQVIPFLIIVFVQVLLLYKIKNKHILAVATGLVLSVSNLFTSLFITHFISLQEIGPSQISGLLYNAGTAFVFGVALIYAFILGVHLWRFKYVSFLFGKAVVNIIPLIGIIISIFSVPDDYKYYMIGSLIPLILDIFLGSLAYYLGIQWNFKNISANDNNSIPNY